MISSHQTRILTRFLSYTLLPRDDKVRETAHILQPAALGTAVGLVQCPGEYQVYANLWWNHRAA